jgi:fatty-acyl-CoA synthase
MADAVAWPAYLPRGLTLPQTSVWVNLEVSARRYPDKPAFVCYDNTLMFARLAADAEKLAGFLQKRCAVAKGDRVLVLAQNSFEFVIAYYAILRADEPHAGAAQAPGRLRREGSDCRAGAVAASGTPH